MVKFPWSPKGGEESFKPLGSNAGFVLSIEGHSVLALKLPAKVAKEIGGKESTSEGILSKLKAKLTHNAETEQWLTVTNIDNPLLEDYDHFGALVVQGLTNATGNAVPISKLTISGGIPITRIAPSESPTTGESESQQNPDPPTINA